MRAHSVSSDSPPAWIRWQIVARMAQYLKRYPVYAWSTLACAVVSTLAGMIFPGITGRAIDRLIHTQATDSLWPYALTCAAAFLIRDGCNALRIWLNNAFEQKVIFDLRCDLYQALQRLPLRWYDQRATGDLMTRVTEDVGSVERVLIDGVEQGVVSLLQIVGIGAYLFWLNPRLALWMLLPIPFLIAGAVWYTTTAHVRYRIQRRAASALNAFLLDRLQGIRQIKSFARERMEAVLFADKANAVREGNLVVMKAWAFYSPSMSFVASFGAVIVLWAGATAQASGSTFTAGQLVSFLLFVHLFYEPVGRLHSLNQMLQSARAAGERVFEILDEPSEVDVPLSSENRFTLSARRTAGQVVYEQVCFRYQPEIPVLRDISFRAEAGQRIALVGPTGAGKSTVVHLLPRFYELLSGHITLDGQDVRTIPLEYLRSQIGVVSQESFLFNTSIRENLLFGRRDATERDLEASLRAARAWDFIQALPDRLDAVVGERGVKLSGGEKQRLAIARALLKDPPVLILDEATASVDTETEQLIQEALEELLSGRTSLIIAHRLSTVRRADLILVLDQGQIRERGTHASLSQAGGLYARLCRAQQNEGSTEPLLSRLVSREILLTPLRN